MALVGPVFFDTSVLLSGILEFGPGSEAAQRVLSAVAERRLRDAHTAWHCCLEFYAVSTRLPEEFRLPPADASRLVQEEILARFRVHQLPEARRRGFWDMASREHIAGGRTYDAHIAEVAVSAGAKTVATDNVRHFSVLRARGIRVLRSSEIAAAL